MCRAHRGRGVTSTGHQHCYERQRRSCSVRSSRERPDDYSCMAVVAGSHRTRGERGLRIQQSEGRRRPRRRPSPSARRAAGARACPVDPIAALITTSQQHYETGERELKARPPRSRAKRIRQAAGRPARVAVRRAHRRPPACAFRPARGPHQRAGDDVAGAGRRLLGAEGRTGIDRRAAEDRHLPEAAGRRRDRRRRQSRPGSHRARHPHPAEFAHLRLRRAVPGPSARVHRGKPDARDRNTCR